MRRFLIALALVGAVACSRPNTPESATAMALKAYQKASRHSSDEVRTEITHQVEPRDGCIVKSCNGYAPIDCEGYTFGSGSFVRNLKDCYRVDVKEETQYKDGCSETTESSYDVVISHNEVISLGHENEPVLCGGGRFNEKAWQAIKSGDGYAALPYLYPATVKVFGQEGARQFHDDADTFLPHPSKDGVILFDFCRAHECTDFEGILAIDTATGQAAGVLVTDGGVRPYAGDFGTQDNWPTVLKDWWTENTADSKR